MDADNGALRSEVKDGMRIDWDVPITMDDGTRVGPFRHTDPADRPAISEATITLSFEREERVTFCSRLSRNVTECLNE